MPSGENDAFTEATHRLLLDHSVFAESSTCHDEGEIAGSNVNLFPNSHPLIPLCQFSSLSSSESSESSLVDYELVSSQKSVVPNSQRVIDGPFPPPLAKKMAKTRKVQGIASEEHGSGGLPSPWEGQIAATKETLERAPFETLEELLKWELTARVSPPERPLVNRAVSMGFFSAKGHSRGTVEHRQLFRFHVQKKRTFLYNIVPVAYDVIQPPSKDKDKEVIFSTRTGAVIAVDVVRGRSRTVFDRDLEPATAIAGSVDLSILALAFSDGSFTLIDMRTGFRVATVIKGEALNAGAVLMMWYGSSLFLFPSEGDGVRLTVEGGAAVEGLFVDKFRLAVHVSGAAIIGYAKHDRLMAILWRSGIAPADDVFAGITVYALTENNRRPAVMKSCSRIELEDLPSDISFVGPQEVVVACGNSLVVMNLEDLKIMDTYDLQFGRILRIASFFDTSMIAVMNDKRQMKVLQWIPECPRRKGRLFEVDAEVDCSDVVEAGSSPLGGSHSGLLALGVADPAFVVVGHQGAVVLQYGDIMENVTKDIEVGPEDVLIRLERVFAAMSVAVALHEGELPPLISLKKDLSQRRQQLREVAAPLTLLALTLCNQLYPSTIAAVAEFIVTLEISDGAVWASAMNQLSAKESVKSYFYECFVRLLANSTRLLGLRTPSQIAEENSELFSMFENWVIPPVVVNGMLEFLSSSLSAHEPPFQRCTLFERNNYADLQAALENETRSDVLLFGSHENTLTLSSERVALYQQALLFLTRFCHVSVDLSKLLALLERIDTVGPVMALPLDSAVRRELVGDITRRVAARSAEKYHRLPHLVFMESLYYCEDEPLRQISPVLGTIKHVCNMRKCLRQAISYLRDVPIQNTVGHAFVSIIASLASKQVLPMQLHLNVMAHLKDLPSEFDALTYCFQRINRGLPIFDPAQMSIRDFETICMSKQWHALLLVLAEELKDLEISAGYLLPMSNQPFFWTAIRLALLPPSRCNNNWFSVNVKNMDVTNWPRVHFLARSGFLDAAVDSCSVDLESTRREIILSKVLDWLEVLLRHDEQECSALVLDLLKWRYERKLVSALGAIKNYSQLKYRVYQEIVHRHPAKKSDTSYKAFVRAAGPELAEIIRKQKRWKDLVAVLVEMNTDMLRNYVKQMPAAVELLIDDWNNQEAAMLKFKEVFQRALVELCDAIPQRQSLASLEGYVDMAIDSEALLALECLDVALNRLKKQTPNDTAFSEILGDLVRWCIDNEQRQLVVGIVVVAAQKRLCLGILHTVVSSIRKDTSGPILPLELNRRVVINTTQTLQHWIKATTLPRSLLHTESARLASLSSVSRHRAIVVRPRDINCSGNSRIIRCSSFLASEADNGSTTQPSDVISLNL